MVSMYPRISILCAWLIVAANLRGPLPGIAWNTYGYTGGLPLLEIITHPIQETHEQ